MQYIHELCKILLFQNCLASLDPLSNNFLFHSSITWYPLLSVSVDLPILNVSYEKDHIIYEPLCLASFTKHVFKIHPSWSVYCISFFGYYE